MVFFCECYAFYEEGEVFVERRVFAWVDYLTDCVEDVSVVF